MSNIRPPKNKRFVVSIPEHAVFMALSHELYSKHGIGPKDAIRILALEYAYNPDARPSLDHVLENRLDERQYMGNFELETSEPERVEVKYIPPDDTSRTLDQLTLDPTMDVGSMTSLEKRINDIWE